MYRVQESGESHTSPLPKKQKLHDDDESSLEDEDYWFLPRKDWDDWAVKEMPSEYVNDLTKSLKTCTTLGGFKTKLAEADLNETQTDPVKACQFTDFLLGVEKNTDLDSTLAQIKDKYWKTSIYCSKKGWLNSVSWRL